MKKSILFIFAGVFLALLFASPHYAVAGKPKPETASVPVFNADSLIFFERWVLQNLSVPADRYSDSTKMNFSVSFSVTKAGAIKGVEVPYPDEYEMEVAAQVVDIMKLATRWTPKMEKGKRVNSDHKIYFSFKFKHEPNRDTSMLYAEDWSRYSAADTTVVVVTPVFEDGGLRNFKRWVRRQIVLPARVDTINQPQSVIVRFVIEKNGTVSNVVVNKADNKLPEEIKRVVSAANGWVPAKVEGEDVRFTAGFTINFGGGADEVEDSFLIKFEHARFPGDMPDVKPQALMKWLNSNVRYPENLENIGKEGKVIAKFTIDEEGYSTDIKILSSPDPLFSAEVARLIFSMPQWTPAMYGGLPTRINYNVPVTFRLTKETKPQGYNRESVGRYYR